MSRRSVRRGEERFGRALLGIPELPWHHGWEFELSVLVAALGAVALGWWLA